MRCWLVGAALLAANAAWCAQPPLLFEPAEGGACQALAKSATGQTQEQVQATAKKVGVLIRVVRQDGISLPVTMDYNLNRLNVEFKGKAVVVVHCG